MVFLFVSLIFVSSSRARVVVFFFGLFLTIIGFLIMFFSIVRCGNKLKFWKINSTCWRNWRIRDFCWFNERVVLIVISLTVIVFVSGCFSRFMLRSNVVLSELFGSIIVIISLGFILRSISCSIVWSWNFFIRFLILMVFILVFFFGD